MQQVTREDALRERTKTFAMRTIRLVRCLPRSPEASVIGRQLLRCGTSVGANYRAACRARSRKDFASKIGICEEEADESGNWLELVEDADMLPAARVEPLRQEADELRKIFTASRYTAQHGRTTHDSAEL